MTKLHFPVRLEKAYIPGSSRIIRLSGSHRRIYLRLNSHLQTGDDARARPSTTLGCVSDTRRPRIYELAEGGGVAQDKGGERERERAPRRCVYAWRDEFSRARQPTPRCHWRIEVSAGGRGCSCCADEGGERERARDKEIGRERERERTKLREYSVRLREGKVRSRRAAASAAAGRRREGRTGEMRGDARGTDGRSAGVIAAGVVRSGGHSITTQWRAYYVVSKRV